MGLLADQRDAIATGHRTSVELVTEAIAAAERLQPQLNAFTEVYAEEALAAAKNTDEYPREHRPPLRGVPVAVKDLYDVSGHVTSACSAAYRNGPAAIDDAPAVWALRNAGAIVIGKTNMHELAFGATNTVSCYGPANNPWDPERIPGGSSGGSGAVVGARIVGLALGTDTGGSIRMPAAFCGATGLKTTWGLLPLAGVTPMAPSLDSVGPITTDASDAQVAFDVLKGGPPVAWTFNPPDGFRIGIARGPWFDVIDPEVAGAIEETSRWFASRGAHVADVSMPWVEAAHDAWLPVALAEFAREHRGLAGRLDDLDPSTQIILMAGVGLPAEDERRARETIVESRVAFESTMRDHDILLMPATPFAAPRHDDETITVAGVDLPVHIGGPSRFTRPISVVPSAVLALPIGFSSGGLPIGAQLVGARNSEHTLLATGISYQRDTEWHTRVPPVHA